MKLDNLTLATKKNLYQQTTLLRILQDKAYKSRLDYFLLGMC